MHKYKVAAVVGKKRNSLKRTGAGTATFASVRELIHQHRIYVPTPNIDVLVLGSRFYNFIM